MNYTDIVVFVLRHFILIYPAV